MYILALWVAWVKDLKKITVYTYSSFYSWKSKYIFRKKNSLNVEIVLTSPLSSTKQKHYYNGDGKFLGFS